MTEYADQRAHDVTWMTAAERAQLDAPQYIVRLHKSGEAPQEHTFASEAEAREFTREAVRAGDALVTFNATPVGQFAVLAPERGWIWTYSGITREDAQAIADSLAAGADAEWVVERVA